MGKPIKQTPQGKRAKLEASLARWRSKALSLHRQNANLQKLVTALYNELVDRIVQAGENEAGVDEGDAWPNQAITRLMTPASGHTKSYTELEARLRAGGVAVPASLAMLAEAERGDTDDPRPAATKSRSKLRG